VLESSVHPAQLKTDVATPAGRTIKGLAELERGKLRATLIDAALAAARN
jgi:pyrroline-5-carboxylate reductase